jgi:hypothetical protein
MSETIVKPVLVAATDSRTFSLRANNGGQTRALTQPARRFRQERARRPGAPAAAARHRRVLRLAAAVSGH